ncbi:putative amid-like NADH oxidoreductase [Zopfia rhizophila CBS 207.26]|uniref:Putative amid-like NADH oxidoreductase n=1 Tax=Zopfia rhizophila CBS 207.26 TaxID=1314779 RepID=A0A6A6DJ12_9PEZI|nr:putative amid-like NADH oxidoreductase [Zopfia rhizophila CBS 207.26]
MPSDKLRLLAKILTFFLPYTLTLLRQRIGALHHKWTYKATPNPKNVVVIGGSFAGFQLVKRLTETLPNGYRVVLIEKNSHLNYLFTFPRFSVVKGYEQLAFIPYTGIASSAPKGIFEHMQGTAMGITDTHVELEGRVTVEYTYLAVATGTSSGLPNKVSATEREDGCAELRKIQDQIQAATKIAVVGGGAVGVELATDIKSFLPEKDVTLVHSRNQLLPTFGKRLHDHVMGVFEGMDIRVILNERPTFDLHGTTLRFADNREEHYDLIIPCTGQTPNSTLIATLSPTSLSRTSRILVYPTLQLANISYPNVFAFGDVAETGGPKMARAAFFQVEIVLENILRMTKAKVRLASLKLKEYQPRLDFEGSIKLTLGEKKYVLYMMERDGRDILVSRDNGKVDLEVGNAWRMFGGKLKEVEFAKRE